VSIETTNPPRAIDGDHAAVRYVVDRLEGAGCALRVDDLGDGSVNILATRGTPRTLLNCHLDTVPVSGDWSRDPFELAIVGDRAHGLGACDVKGAAACILAAVEESDGPAAVLFTTDEEAGQARCVRTFAAARPLDVDLVVVAEPTRLTAVTKHRGLVSTEVVFDGAAAHSSQLGATSAVHAAVRWSHEVLTVDGASDLRLNLGRIEGGTKPNVVASSCSVRVGLRPWSDVDVAALLARWRRTGEAPPASVRTTFRAPALDSGIDAAAPLVALGVALGTPVDFWTEAALFAEAAWSTVVFGPGDIAQAHAPDEWVEIAALEAAAERYAELLAA
jgi:acetylornithine deacetylase